MKRLLLAAILLLPAGSLLAQAPVRAPLPEEFLGYALGTRFTPHHRIVGYFRALEAASPLVRVTDYGRTYEGRPLLYAVITSEANHAAIDRIRGAVAAINRPDRTSRAEAERIAAGTPAVVWLGFGIHGNESSSSESAMRVASQLLSGDAVSRRILESLVVIIDPVENPDGRDRYVSWYEQSRGTVPNPNPAGAEHFEPWPGGRFNHYLIDMNRDWSWMTQGETEARVAAYRTWNPQLFVDFHEMGYDNSYFFPPDAHPINTNISGDIQKWLEIFGRANGEAFAQRGWPFFVSETFDLFYPGYGDSWPSLRGAIGMTYEMAGGGRAGTAVRKEDDTVLTLSDRVERHFTTAMTTIETAAGHRGELILRSWNALSAQTQKGTATYFLLPGAPSFPHAVDLLRAQGIDVGRLDSAARLQVTSTATGLSESREIPAGTAVVTTRQPLGGLAEALLERSAAMPQPFIEQQRKRAETDQENEFYDITAWAIPIAFNVEAWVSSSPGSLRTSTWPDRVSAPAPADARFGYLIDGFDPSLYHSIGELLRRRINFSVSDTELTFASRRFSRGSLVVLRSNNAADLGAAMREVARSSGAAVVATDSAWDTGTALGSEKIHFVRDPRIAILKGESASPTGFGMLWHVLDADLRIPHAVVPVSRVGSIDLGQFRVIILPDGDGYSRELGKSGIERLQAWTKAGGTLVAIKGAGDFVRDKDVELSKVKVWPGKKDDEEAPPPERHNDYRIPGAAFRTVMRPESYLTFGLQAPPAVILEGNTALLPSSYKSDNVISIADKNPLVAGFAFPESIERVEGSPFLVSEACGNGKVITFADQPFFRLFWRGTLPLLVNAAVYSPSF